jgi:hypothetical protein
VFYRSGDNWTAGPTLKALDAQADDFFGTSVAISGDYVIVGAPGVDNFAGAAYVFHRTGTGPDTWVQQAILVGPDDQSGNYFAVSVSIDGEYAIVGAAQADGTKGAAYVFHHTEGTWVPIAKLTAPDAAASSQFGLSVAISGTSVIIGARGAKAAYVY